MYISWSCTVDGVCRFDDVRLDVVYATLHPPLCHPCVIYLFHGPSLECTSGRSYSSHSFPRCTSIDPLVHLVTPRSSKYLSASFLRLIHAWLLSLTHLSSLSLPPLLPHPPHPRTLSQEPIHKHLPPPIDPQILPHLAPPHMKLLLPHIAFQSVSRA